MNEDKLNLPPVSLKLREEEGILKVFDPIRNKYVAFTPEENVRRHFTAWLTDSLHYPATLMANEVTISFNGMNRRCDTVVYNRDMTPMVIVEYKAPDVTVTQAVFDQIVRYNMILRARYLIVSNGIRHYCCVMDYEKGTYHFIPKVPDYMEIKNGFNLN